MTPRFLPLALAGLLGAGLGGAAQAGPAPQADAASCRPEAAGHDVFGRREALIARYKALPAPCLEQMVRGCDEAAGEMLLDVPSAALCSIGYEALLQGRFQGDFQALMAWWRQEAQDPESL